MTRCYNFLCLYEVRREVEIMTCKEMIFSHDVASTFSFKHEAITNKMILMIFSFNEASVCFA